ncbi:MAG: L-ribulose-5-phosphate 4-epimerase UlaF [Fimbriimonadaceae bacterium]|nr:L-ribulose-5-phosphate 4-epimerase UlaF [Fimbriimonadaceae bacterium]
MRGAVCRANRLLPASGLVTAHSGNVSGLDRASGVVYIKPSGFDYEALTEDDIVAVDLETGTSQGDLRPSVDLPHHLFLYRNLEGIGGIVHTHSNYATAFAACGMSIPAVLTAIADEFGGEIPCAPYVDNEGDHIGHSILQHRSTRAPAILLANHGVFAWGETAEAALKAAIMVEDTAKTVFLAMQIGRPHPLPPDEVEKWWDRYQNRYGQTERT